MSLCILLKSPDAHIYRELSFDAETEKSLLEIRRSIGKVSPDKSWRRSVSAEAFVLVPLIEETVEGWSVPDE